MSDWEALQGRAGLDEASLEAARAEREGRLELDEALASPEAARPRIAPSTRSISDEAVSLIVFFEVTSEAVYERKYRRPIWPRGASGVTIGVGYDVGYVTQDELWDDWRGAIPDPMIVSLERAIGVTGSAAEPLAEELQGTVDVPFTAADAVFRTKVLPRYVAVTERSLPGTAALSADSLGALVSLVYNRGPSFRRAGDRYTEMRAVLAHMASGDLTRIPGEIRSMKRLWPDLPGLRKRRDLEAELFERGLAQRELVARVAPLVLPAPGVVRGLAIGKADVAMRRRYLASVGGPEGVLGRTDDRSPIDRTEDFPYSAICCLRLARGDREEMLGTGWLVGPRTVVTASHCIRYGAFAADEIIVIPGRDGFERPFGTYRSRRFSVAEGWLGTPETKSRDLACIHLDTPVGVGTGWFELASWSDDRLANHTVNISGYPSDRAGQTRQYFDEDIITFVGPSRLHYLVDTMAGQSGAPVWAYAEPGAPATVVGAHSWGNDADPRTAEPANSATWLTDEFTRLIAAWIERDGGRSA